MTLTILIFGFVFGAILQYAGLNKFNTIGGLATLDNLSVPKAIAVAIGVGSILLSVTIGFGYAGYHVKPFILGGIIFGGLIFGSGMAILGYCPGTLAISLGEGSIDAFIGILGGLIGGWVFTLILPSINGIFGPDFGAISLGSLIESSEAFYLITLIIGILFIAIAFWLNKKDGASSKRWLYAGIALAFLNVLVFSKAAFSRPIGASTTFPYLGDLITGSTQNNYFSKIEHSGNWEAIFLAGAFIAGLVISVFKKDFKLTLIHTNWAKYKGTDNSSRILWAFVGGFILIFGARVAGGCTSGHILSGGMQLSVSSLVFALFTFVGLLITGRIFYGKNMKTTQANE